MKKKVWIVNHYASWMMFNKGGRHYWFSKYLRQEGYEPVVFCCNINHKNHTDQGTQYIDTTDFWVEAKAEDINTPFVFVTSSPYEGNGIDRVKNMIGFYKNVQKVAKEYAAKNGKPDVVYASSPHPLDILAGIKIAKFFGVKCVGEVRDLWPEAIVTYSKRIKKDSLVAKVLYRGERYLYTKADAMIFTQEGAAGDYIREKGWDHEHGGPIEMSKMHHINNGVDLQAFDENLANYPYEDEDLDNPNMFKVVYAGAIRRINNLGIILDVAKLIEDKSIKFIIFGNGDELEALQQRVKDENIANVVFKGNVNKQYIPSIDSKADLNLVHWEMSPLVRVGESYNKAFEYFAAGKPVFYTVRPGYSIVEKFNCGKITDGFTPEEIAKGIVAMSKLSDEEKKVMAVNARKTAEAYDFKVLTKKLIEIIEGL